MTGYSGGSGGDLFGNALDTSPVASEFHGLYPPGTFEQAASGESQQQPNRSLVEPAPDRKGKRKKRKKQKQPGTPSPHRQSTSTPGGEEQPSRSRVQQGK